MGEDPVLTKVVADASSRQMTSAAATDEMGRDEMGQPPAPPAEGMASATASAQELISSAGLPVMAAGGGRNYLAVRERGTRVITAHQDGASQADFELQDRGYQRAAASAVKASNKALAKDVEENQQLVLSQESPSALRNGVCFATKDCKSSTEEDLLSHRISSGECTALGYNSISVILDQG
jgi:hypothetical protein